MALLPLQARQLLVQLTNDFRLKNPIYNHHTDMRGLTAVMVTVYVQRPNVEPLEKTFSSTYEDNIIIAEDLASRMALYFIHAYYTGDNRVAAYFNMHIFGHTKKAWQMVADRLAEQLNVARDTIRRLHDKLYQSNLDYNILSDRVRHSQMFETLKNNAHLKELSDEAAKQRCQIDVLENRLQYLANVNAMLWTNHHNLLQLTRPSEASASNNNVRGRLPDNEHGNGHPLPLTRANLTEL